MKKDKNWEIVKNLAYNGMDNLSTLNYRKYLFSIDKIEEKLAELEIYKRAFDRCYEDYVEMVHVAKTRYEIPLWYSKPHFIEIAKEEKGNEG